VYKLFSTKGFRVMLSPAMITDKNHLMSILNTRKILILVCLTVIVSGCAGKKKTEENLAQQQVEELYTKGKKALNVGNYSFATQYFRALEASYPYGEYTEQAKLDMIFAFNKSGQTEKTVEAAENFIKLYPTHKNVDYAYYMKGVANFERKQSSVDRFMKGGKAAVRDPQPYRDSEEAFNDLIKRYPQSIYTQDAKLRVVFIRNALAQRELAVAQFYFDSKTFVAAVNRCKTIIYKYETSPAVEGALVLMEKAYAEMGLTELVKSTHSVLLDNFPNSQREPFETKKKGIFSRLNPF
jgi:outer membrane protein assembly factor BamD